MSDKLQEALDLLDKWREIFHNNNITVYDDENNDDNFNLLDETHTATCRILVDTGRYQESDLFWTQEALDKARQDAEQLMKDIKWE